MSRRVAQLSRWILTASLLFGGVVSSTHHHAPTRADDGLTASAVCTCQFHHRSEGDLPAPSRDNDDGDCPICKLLANFHADCQQIDVPETDFELAGFVTSQPTRISSPSFRLFQGRAPPTFSLTT